MLCFGYFPVLQDMVEVWNKKNEDLIGIINELHILILKYMFIHRLVQQGGQHFLQLMAQLIQTVDPFCLFHWAYDQFSADIV